MSPAAISNPLIGWLRRRCSISSRSASTAATATGRSGLLALVPVVAGGRWSNSSRSSCSMNFTHDTVRVVQRSSQAEGGESSCVASLDESAAASSFHRSARMSPRRRRHGRASELGTRPARSGAPPTSPRRDVRRSGTPSQTRFAATLRRKPRMKLTCDPSSVRSMIVNIVRRVTNPPVPAVEAQGPVGHGVRFEVRCPHRAQVDYERGLISHRGTCLIITSSVMRLPHPPVEAACLRPLLGAYCFGATGA